MKVSVDYTLLGKIENEIRQSDYILDDIVYMEGVDFFVFVDRFQEDTFREWMTNLTSGQCTISVIEERFLEF